MTGDDSDGSTEEIVLEGVMMRIVSVGVPGRCIDGNGGLALLRLRLLLVH